MKLNDKLTTISDALAILRSPKERYCVDLFVSSKHVTRGCQPYKLKLEQISSVIVYEGRDHEVSDVKNNAYGSRYLTELIPIVSVLRSLETSG